MHPVVKNKDGEGFDYRVVPGNAVSSMLYLRMTEDIDSISGIMPLYSGDAWNAVKQEHISNIVSWINKGAQDMFGTPYQAGNQAPQMQGVVAYEAGNSTPISRDPSGQILVPANVSELTLWFSFSDDETNSNELQTNILKLSTEIFDFEDSVELNLATDQSITEIGYFGGNVTYTHSITIDPSIFDLDQAVFMRVNISDGDKTAEIPSNGSPDYIKLYFSLKRF